MKLATSALVLALIGLQSMLTEAIENTVAVVESEANLKCQTHSRNCNGVTWRMFSGSSNPVTIFRDTTGIFNSYKDRYSVDNSSGCDLVIKNVQLTDAGRFVCEYVAPDKSTILVTAFLIILKTLPSCAVNATDGSAVEGDGVQLTCEVTFNGTNNASLKWKDLENVPKSVQNEKTVKLSHSVTVIRPEIPSYECITTFELPKDIKGLASNIPTAPPCRTNLIKLLYPVKTVTLSPGGSTHPPDSPITCSSDGNPSPTLKWQITRELDAKNESWKDIPGETSKTFSTGNATGNYYRCVASNTVRDQNYVAFSNQFQVNYTANTASPNNAQTGSGSVVGIAAGVAAGVVALLVVIVIIFLCLRNGGNETKEKPVKGKYCNADQLPLRQTPNATINGSQNPHPAPVASVRPYQQGESLKRPTVPPPEPMPRKDLPKKKSPNPPPEREEVLYASIASDQEPVRFVPKQTDNSNAVYADIGVA